MNDEPASQLGEYIKKLRIQRHMTLRDVATRAGIDSGGLTRMEHGAVRHPHPGHTDCASTSPQGIDSRHVRAGWIHAARRVTRDWIVLAAKYECLSRMEQTELADMVEKLVRLHDTKDTDPKHELSK